MLGATPFTQIREEIEIHRRGGKFEIDAEVVLPFSQAGETVSPPMMVPNMPSPEERARHEVDHMPYAPWYRSCVAWKGKTDGHLVNTSDHSGVKGVACDYCVMGDAVEGDAKNERCLPVLVLKFYGDRWVKARVVSRTDSGEFAVKDTAEDLQQSGMCRFLYTSDGLIVIESLKQDTVHNERNS